MTKQKNQVMMKKIFISTLLLLSVFSAKLFSQQNDLGMWNTFNFEYKLSKKFSLNATEEFRLKENLSQINLFYTNLGVSYRFNENFKFSPTYRFIQKRFDDGFFGMKHRLMLDFSYKHKFGPLNFSTRTRLQGEIAYPNASALWKNIEYYWRQKFDFSFDLNSSRFSPYFGIETRVQFYTPYIKEFQGFGFSRTRIYAGCDFKINLYNTVGAYYLIQNDFQVNDPTTLYIIGLEYSLSLGKQ